MVDKVKSYLHGNHDEQLDLLCHIYLLQEIPKLEHYVCVWCVCVYVCVWVCVCVFFKQWYQILQMKG